MSRIIVEHMSRNGNKRNFIYDAHKRNNVYDAYESGQRA